MKNKDNPFTVKLLDLFCEFCVSQKFEDEYCTPLELIKFDEDLAEYKAKYIKKLYG